MFYGNSELLQKSLHNDLNNLIKNVKTREDQHLTLLQYNKGLIEQLSQMDSIPFFQEQLAKHRTFLSSVTTAHQKIKEEEQEMLQKYVCTLSGESGIVKLMGRVIARVIQILQASLDKAKYLDQQLQKKHHHIKNSMLDLLQEKDKINIHELLETIITFVRNKCMDEIKNLQEIIKILIDGDFTKLNNIYVSIQTLSPEPIKPKISPDKKEIKKSFQKSREKIQKMKEEARQMEKVKKKKTKLAMKMIGGLYSTMDLSRQQFMEDMIFNNKQDKRKQLYQEIFSRNKFNYAQIIDFQAKRQQFEEKIKLFKQSMKIQSQKIQEALVFIKPKPIKEPQEINPKIQEQRPTSEEKLYRKQVKSQAAEDIKEQFQPLMPEKQRLFRRREKKILSKGPSPKLIKQSTFVSMQSTQEGFQHIKFDVKNEQFFSRSNRARLPQISGRSSLDNRYEGKPTKQPEQRINIVKNIDIGTFNPQTKVDIEKKSPRERPTPIDNNGFQYTFYVRRKANKFYETRNNFVF